jgi:cytidine deaminase
VPEPLATAAFDDELFSAALAVQANAYVPYSHFGVGCAVRSVTGRVYVGCNVENAAYPQGWCAEASALSAMVSAGETAVAAVVTVADGDRLTTCCGGCRQKVREFAVAGTLVHACGPEGLRRTFTVDELLPESFGPDHLR